MFLSHQCVMSFLNLGHTLYFREYSPNWCMLTSSAILSWQQCFAIQQEKDSMIELWSKSPSPIGYVKHREDKKKSLYN